MAAIARKIDAKERLGTEDGVALYETKDLLGLGRLANREKERRTENDVYFVRNRHINPTNVCVAYCKLCAFGRPQGVPGAYTLSLEEIFDRADPGGGIPYKELHIVGGHHPDLPFSFFVDMLRGLRERYPSVHLKAFTMTEIVYFSRISGKSTRSVLEELKEAGLDTMPGGGAEIFDPEVRHKIARGKATGKEWLDVAREAHELGIRTNATMLYGHVENARHRVSHLLQLRQLQDESGGFLAFIPLAFHPARTGMSRLPKTAATDDLKNIAVARLLLDNFDHIKAYWVMIGEKLAQVALSFGADDLDGTVVEEKIYHDAGATTAQGLTLPELRRLIVDAGRRPVERDALYRRIATDSKPSLGPLFDGPGPQPAGASEGVGGDPQRATS